MGELAELEQSQIPVMAGSWQAHGISWQGHGRVMAGSWQAHGRVMAGSWQAHGRVMAGSRHGHGMVMAWSWHLMAGSWQGHVVSERSSHTPSLNTKIKLPYEVER